MRPEERHGAARRAEIGCGRLKHSTVQRAFELASDQLAQRVLTASVGALRVERPKSALNAYSTSASISGSVSPFRLEAALGRGLRGRAECRHHQIGAAGL
jgi:hypothetical protein